MTYKTILTVLTSQDTAATPLAQATALATTFNSHVEALCLGVDHTQTGYYYAGTNAMILQETMTRAKTDAANLQAYADAELQKAGIPFSSDAGIAQIADMGRHVAQQARFSDLVVLGQPYGKDKGVEAEPVVESALFEGRAPVLVVPDDAPQIGQPKTVLVAWNESTEAMAAIRKSLPFLAGADLVRIVVIDPPQHGPDRSDPGGLLAQMLARHGVACEIDVLSKTLPRVSDVLIRHASDTQAELIVMGAYGHSRFREAILGGATRNMLEKATVPVLMAH
ncbi:universal stress protein [Pseudophaeobacter flagellatus]|uniref:universal stress protein n=1 Tax=Pseudophaeobacter flagellatus TaxID=2899119 RepID=UPI001E372F20|nr:universal stress protein [Pseudophaeobacter flagellatus]MCD9148121.1 universal stress protein [Pseudophaeobacter flagellatus]